MGRIALTKVTDTSPFRKIAMGTWETAKDPSVYGSVEIDMKPTLDLLEAYSAKHGVKITPNHLVGKAISYCMKRRPEINGMIRRKRIYLRKHVALFYQINIPGEGEDKIKKATLSGTVVHDAENLSTAEIAKALMAKAELVRTGKDKEIKKGMDTFKFIPWWLAGKVLDFMSFVTYGLNINASLLGIPKDPFGSVMLTNIGGLGIDQAWAPLCAYTRVPLLLTIGAIQEKPWVVDGKIEIRPILPIGVTFDHRLVDGIHASQMARDFKDCFMNPEKFLFEK